MSDGESPVSPRVSPRRQPGRGGIRRRRGREAARRGSGAALPIALDVIVMAAALALAAFPPSADTVERLFSRGFYARMQPWLTGASSRIPFAVCDVLLIGLAIAVVLLWALRLRSSRGRVLSAIRRCALDTGAIAGLIYLAFMGLWGLNYLRVPLSRALDYDEARAGDRALTRLEHETIERLDAEVAPAHREGWPGDLEMSRRLRQSFEAALADLGSGPSQVPASTKVSLLDPYLGATGISAFTNPFGLEIIANTALLPIEKPFTLAHEWAHVAGYADESEANFIALLACARSRDPMIRYSGWLALYRYLPDDDDLTALASGAAPDPPEPPSAGIGSGRAEVARAGHGQGRPPRAPAGNISEPLRISAQVAADLRAIDERIHRRLNPGVSRAQSRIYDRFLKANRVRAGVRSYDLFVRLLLGTRFDSEWVPARRRTHGRGRLPVFEPSERYSKGATTNETQ